MLKKRYEYYGQHIVKGFYRDHFQGFDRQIVLVDCLQPLNQGADVFNDMRQALTQLMRSFHYGKRTLLRRLFSPVLINCYLQPLRLTISRQISMKL